MSSGAVIGGFAAAFGTASALGVIGIVVHVCHYQPNARSRLLARRRSFIERARQSHVTFVQSPQNKALELEDIECFCPQLRYLGADNEPALVLPHDRTAVCLSEWLEQKQRVLEDTQVCINMEASPEDSEWCNLEAESQRGSGGMNEVVDVKLSSTSCNHTTHHSHKIKQKTCPLLIGGDMVPDEVCAICLDSVQVDSLIRVVKCGHAFHSSCIVHWLTNANRCPLCNTAAVSEEDKKYIELKRSAHGTTSPSVWPFPKPNLSESDIDECLFRSLERVLKEVQSRCANEEQLVE
ncbi:zinc finger (C3HC4-type RING finger) family protein [Galdieria sulphuraria]|uniref:Zinc finger (C3HC4-type RING finger) family protein n=1 Tax=Galdieria sulphuraria TaxID=130081 RepID=M2Y9K7_GALSU|nr:zinc finger (C3HC4-type RING finger) family protein [Galdieria sulphuraria]EME32763.1 zinc finger (C3HC4-type RING finger) family protein [Galdieria sulphuraria]|eukprot:XP_005709283.1 zinc finger (C3HC4-type RING finger) family protein [Galdieria sulphuraria]